MLSFASLGLIPSLKELAQSEDRSEFNPNESRVRVNKFCEGGHSSVLTLDATPFSQKGIRLTLTKLGRSSGQEIFVKNITSNGGCCGLYF